MDEPFGIGRQDEFTGRFHVLRTLMAMARARAAAEKTSRLSPVSHYYGLRNRHLRISEVQDCEFASGNECDGGWYR